MDIFLFISLIWVLLLVITALTSIYFCTPYVPVNKATVKKILEIADIKKDDKVYDLGCGDARILIQADRAGARAVGFEIAPLIFLLAKTRVILSNSRAKIKFKNFLKSDLSDADIIISYLTPNILKKLEPKLKQELRRGTVIISPTFTYPTLKAKKVYPHKEKIPKIFLYKI